MAKVTVKFNKDLDEQLKRMAVRAVKEQNGNRCYYCGAEVEDMSGVGESQLPVCTDCVAKGLPVSSGQ